MAEYFKYCYLPFSSGQGNGTTCSPLSLLHSFTLFLCALSECPPPGPTSSVPTHPPRPAEMPPLYRGSRNLLAGNPPPSICSPHSISSQRYLAHYTEQNPSQTFNVGDWSFLIHFCITSWTNVVSYKEVSIQEISFLLTNFLPFASSCLSLHFCQTLVVKGKISFHLSYMSKALCPTLFFWHSLH